MDTNCPKADHQHDHCLPSLAKIMPPARQWPCYGAMTALVFMLSACLAPPIKPPSDKLETISKILVVPMESPPLEVFPDPMMEGALGYGQNVYENLPLSLTVSDQLYKSFGGVLTVGRVENGTSDAPMPQQKTPIHNGPISGLRPLAEFRDYWISSLVIAEQTVARLNTARRGAVLSSQYRSLPMPDEDRTAYLGNWRSAFQRWYDDETARLDYRQLAADDVDAVLEVGVGAYRIFYGQVSLQLLLKLIDPASGHVIGRVDVKDYRVENSSDALLADDAAQFKAVINSMGARLAASGLEVLGLSRSTSMYSVASQPIAVIAVTQ